MPTLKGRVQTAAVLTDTKPLGAGKARLWHRVGCVSFPPFARGTMPVGPDVLLLTDDKRPP